MYLGPNNVGRFEQMGVSFDQPKWTNFKFFQQLLVQNQNSERVYFLEKITSHVCRALWGGPFWLNASLPTGQIWADQYF